MSGAEVRRVSREDIQLVQNLIERCLQLYMNQKEVVETLLVEAKIEPGFTELVWQKLEEENREFFKAYHIRLMLKQQIMIFNKLLEQQVEVMQNIRTSGGAPLPVSNGSSLSSSLHQAPSCYVTEPTVAPSRPDNSLHHSVLNGDPPVHQGFHGTNDISAPVGRVNISTNMLSSQNSHIGMINGMNRMAIKSEPSYSNSSLFAFGADGNVINTQSTIGDTCGTSFSNAESNSHSVNEPLSLDADTSSFGFLGQIPRSFSLSDLTADYSQSSDILESYARCPFLAADACEFFDSPDRVCQEDSKQLDSISEAVSYDDFTSD